MSKPNVLDMAVEELRSRVPAEEQALVQPFVDAMAQFVAVTRGPQKKEDLAEQFHFEATYLARGVASLVGAFLEMSTKPNSPSEARMRLGALFLGILLPAIEFRLNNYANRSVADQLTELMKAKVH